LSKRKAALEELKALLNQASIQDIFLASNDTMRESLLAVAIKERPDSDAKLTNFFLQHPFFKTV
jgi:hypothetical protein